ncbi:MAG: hypothetical protein LBT44_02935 [Clostridiales bacterium]|jgi:hypothetical protein|nr:hypothetical protein [Clostridiales bacterium]
MKSKTLFAVLLIIVLTVLSACGSNNTSDADSLGESEPSGSKASVSTESPVSGENPSVLLGPQWIGSLGTYFIEDNLVEDPNGSILIGTQNADGLYTSTNYRRVGYQIQFWDDSAETKIVLCNKPNCKHDTADCNAYLAPGEQTHGFLWIAEINGKVYCVDAENSLFVMDKNGTNRKKLLQFDNKYSLLSAALRDTVVYADVNYIAPNPENKVYESDVPMQRALLAINLAAENCKELYSFKQEDNTKFLWLSNEKAVYYYEQPSAVLSEYSQQALDAEENGHKASVFSINLEDGIRNDIISTTAFSLNPVLLDSDNLYFHSRKDKQIKQIDINNGKETVVAENISGYLLFPENRLFDGKLLYQADNQRTDAYANPQKVNESYWVDVSTGKSNKITYGISSGNTAPFYTFVAETSKYFVLANDGDFLRIGKDDFWSGSYEKAVAADFKP